LIQTTKRTSTTIQRLIVLLPHYKSIRLSIIFFIDLLKYNYLSRSEGQAKMVHSLFRSNACYFSFYQQTYLLPTAAQSLYSEKLLYTPPRSLQSYTNYTTYQWWVITIFSYIFFLSYTKAKHYTTTHITTVIIIVSNKQ